MTEAAGNLQKARLINYSRGHITVLDRPKLEARVCECYAVVKREYDRLIPTALRHGIPNDQSRGLKSTSTRRSRRSSGSPNVPV